MQCFVCDAACRPFFRKDFASTIGTVDYVRCPRCGCAYAETLIDWSEDRWATSCRAYHQARQGKDTDPDDPRRAARLQHQARSLSDALRQGWLPTGPWLDYGCGDGLLADLVTAAPGRPSVQIDRYDRYLRRPNHIDEATLHRRTYAVVVCTALFEHVRSRRELDRIVARLDDAGTLALHTLVRGTIPNEPSWFYLLPVHTAFFTNEGMKRLFDQWGFGASTYDFAARLWFAFRGPLPPAIPAPWPRSADGFTAYWP